MVLGTFTFADPARTLVLNPSEVERLHATVERVLAGKVHPTLRTCCAIGRNPCGPAATPPAGGNHQRLLQ
jgi:hypothetical protein